MVDGELDLGLPPAHSNPPRGFKKGIAWKYTKWAKPHLCQVCLERSAGTRAPNYARYVRKEAGVTLEVCSVHATELQDRDIEVGTWEQAKAATKKK